VGRAEDVVNALISFTRPVPIARCRKGSQLAQGRHDDYDLTTATAIAHVKLLLLLL
jgi:hypothetical protein